MIEEEMFERQSRIFLAQQQDRISRQKVVIVGIGALGQMVAETCVRSGYCHLILIDGDSFTYNNFNRQLYAEVETVGKPKVDVAEKALLRINPDLDIRSLEQFWGPESDEDIIPEDCILLDCTDDIKTKVYLEEAAEEKKIPLVHGAIDGWYGQMAVVFPGDGLLKTIYRERDRKTTAALMITANVVASLQVRALIGVTLGENEKFRKKMTFVDMNQSEIQTITMSELPNC